MRTHLLPLLLTGVLSCEPAADVPESAELPQHIAAVVSGVPVSVDAVRLVAMTQQVKPERALELVVTDAVFALAAGSQPGGEHKVRHAERSAYARGLLGSLLKQAREQGHPSAEAIDALARVRWWEFDRPELRRVIHAVALTRNTSDREAAHALIEKVAAATDGISAGQEFAETARKYAKDAAVELRVEALEPLAADGRAVDPARPPLPGAGPTRYSKKFAEAVHALVDAGDRSPIVETEYGFHVILLLERIEERRLAPAETRALLTPELMAQRADKLEEQLMQHLLSTIEVEVDRSAAELTRKVMVAQ